MTDKARISYELDCKTEQLRIEMQDAKYHLDEVSKKLKEAKTDIWLFAAFIVVPPMLYSFLWIFRFFFPILVYVLISAVASVIEVLYVLTLPAWIYQLAKYIIIYKMHRKDAMDVAPVPQTKYENKESEESTYQVALQKLSGILSIYYLYQQRLQGLRENFAEGRLDDVDDSEILQELTGMVFYQMPRASSPFNGKVASQAKLYAWGLFILIVLFLVLL